MSRPLFSASAWMIAATTVLNLSMVVYHRIMSSSLGDAYAELYALTGLVNVSGVLALGVGAWVTKAFAGEAELRGEGSAWRAFRRWARRAVWPWLAVVLGLAALAPLGAAYLRLQSTNLWFLVVALFGVGLILSSARALLQGVHRFRALAASLALEGLSKVLVASALVKVGLGSAGALLGTLAAQLAGGIPILLWARQLPATPGASGSDEPLPTRPRELWMDAAVLTLFSLLCFLDGLIVKHHFDDARASLYSRAALVAKSFLFLTSALNMVLLPAVAAKRVRDEDSRSILWRFIALAAVAELAGLAVVWIWTPWVIRLLCGSDEAFQVLVPMVRIFALAVIPLALLQLALYFHMALASRRMLVGLSLAVPLYAALLQWWATDEGSVIMLLGVFATALLALALFRLPGRSRTTSFVGTSA